MKKANIVGIGASLFVMTTLAVQAHADADDAIEYRESVMHLFSWNLKPMGAMLKGKIPFDSASFARHAQDLAAVSSVDLMSGFPEGSDEGETEARVDIWLNFEDFQDKFKALQSASRQLNEAATGSDQTAIKAAFGDVGKACKACHKAYKD